jgi:N-formylglutamate amidohydrolase
MYYAPYHATIEVALRDLRQRHAHVLFFDAHSIKRRVPSIRPEPFADVILGDQKGKTAHHRLARTALDALQSLHVAHNEPFMGGYLTRSFGRPAEGIHALQLEMSQDLYMDEDAVRRDPAKEARVQAILRKLLTALARRVTELP